MTKLEAAKERFKNYNKENNSTANTFQNSKLSRAKQRFRARELGLDTLQSDLEFMGKTIKGVYDGWQSEETMKNTKASINTMYNRLLSFQDYRKQYGITEGDNEINELVSSYKSILDGWDDLAMEYGQYKDAEAYNKSVQDANAYAEQTEKAKTDDLTIVQAEVDDLKAKLNIADSIYSRINYGATDRAHAQEMVIKNRQAEKELQDLLSSYGYDSYEDLKKAVEEKEAYYKQAKYIQDGIKLTNDALNAEDFEENNKYVDSVTYGWGGKPNFEDDTYAYINNPTVEDKRLFGDTITAREMIDNTEAAYAATWDVETSYEKDALDYLSNEEIAVYNYYYNTQGKEKANEYLHILLEELAKRKGMEIAEGYRDRSALEKILYGIPAGLDQFTSGVINAFNFTDDYIPTTYTQYASQGVKKQLYNTGPNLPEWLGGTSLGQAAFDVVSAGANMAPSMVAGGISEFVLPGSGTYVTASLMGLSALGNAYQQMLNQGYSKTQSRTYATLVGISEAALSALLSGMIGGKATKKAVETAIKGIDNGFLRFAVRWGMEGLSEIPEESLQGILEPMFQNFAVGYELNDMSELDWSQIAYEGLLGGVSGLGFGFGHSAINTTVEQSGIKTATLNYGFSQGSVDALIKNGLAMPEGSVAYSQAVKAQAKVQNGKKVSGTALYNLATAIQSEITTKSEVRLAELGVSKSEVGFLAPIVAKAVFGEKLTLEEQSVLNNSEAARQVVKELSADPVNTIWKDAVKDEALQSTANGEGDSVSAVDTIDDGETTNLASGVVQGADGRQYYDDGSGDEYFGDAEGVDAPHLTTASGGASPQGEAIDRGAFDLSEPLQKDIARAPTSQEAFDEAITGKQKTNIQRHIVDICKQLDSGINTEFVDGLETNGKFVRSQNKILIRSDLSAVQMYVEVFKHEFMHRLETKQLYGKFFDYCFKNSTAFEQYVRAELKTSGVDYNVDTATRVGVIEAYTKYKFDQYKNSKDIPKTDREAFTMEDAQEEIVADFFAQILFQGEKYRTRIIEALENADGEAFIGIGDEISSEAALLELQQKEPTLFEQVVQWIKDIIYKLRGMPQAKSVADDLEYIEGLLTRVYNSKDSQRLFKLKQREVKYSFGVTQKDIDDYVDAAYAKENTEDYKKYAMPTEKLINDVSDEIDIADYVHALRDNDIRHIKNSHGEGTNEKYPVTSDDIKLIPWIVQNYDKVFVIKREKGKIGIIYVKVNEDGLIYFLEQVTTIYGNEPLLVNKQMIKTGIEDIPNLKGFVDAINKKESEAEFLADLKKVHEVYAQSVYQPHYNINIPNHKENVNGNNVMKKNNFNLTEPDIDSIEISDEAEFLAGLNDDKLNKAQKHIVDICKQLDSGITVEFVDGLETNGKFVRSQNKILIRSDLSAVQMYVEVFKHEFMHRLETKKLYGKFFDYCFKKSTAFEQYVRAEIKGLEGNIDIENMTRKSVFNFYTEYKYNEYKNAEGIPKTDRDAFTMENAQEEIIADFFAQILFQGEKYRTRIIEALGNADGEAFIGIGDEISSEAALMELKQKEPTLFEQVVQWIKDIIYKLRGMPQAKSLVEQLDNEINLLESMARRAYQSKDSKRVVKKKYDEIKFSLINNNTFESNVDIVSTMNDADALQNKEEGNFVRVMYGTPTIVRDNVSDAENLDVIISFYSLYLATRKTGILEGHYHNLGSETIKKLPEYISNPDAIIRTNNDRLNLFVQISTAKGNNGILSIELNTVKDINNNYGKYNLVVTVFSAGDNYIKNNIIKNAKKVEYQKEDLMQVNPQLYEWLTIVNNKSSLNSIAEKEYIVNDEDSTRLIRKKQNDLKYTIKKSSDGNYYVEVENNSIFVNNDGKSIAKALSDIVKVKFKDFINVSGQKIGLNGKTVREWQHSKDAQYLLVNSKQAYIDKLNTFNNVDEILMIAKNYVGEAIKHERKDNFVEFARGTVDFKVSDRGYSADVIVGTTKSNVTLLYDIVGLQKKVIEEASHTAQDRRAETTSINSNIISNFEEIVNNEDSKRVVKENAAEEKYSFEGYSNDGKGKYKSNFPKGTPKSAKGERILEYIQKVWSKKPIRLKITDGNHTRYINAKFDPFYDESGNLKSDASKLMGGNRHRTSAEQRVTLDLADDYYQIASEATYNYSKKETGKENPTHKDVRVWHYFVNDIYFAEYDSDEYIPYRVSINIKERGDDEYFYSFSAEKQGESDTLRTLHAAVNADKNTNANVKLSNNRIPRDKTNVNKQTNVPRKRFILTEPDITKIELSDEVEFWAGLNDVKLNKAQKHIVDICKQLDSGITTEFVDGLETNGKFVRSQNKILIRSDLSAVQMYVEVFKHEFMHRLETKQLYGKFFDYCFKNSTAFEQYVRAELKTSGVDYNVDTATRVGVIEAYTKYKFDQYKNSKDIPKTDREAFTMEMAQEEIVADFFAQILFQGEKYRTRIIEALENADGESLVGIGDEISSEAALMELYKQEPTLFEQVVQWFKDVIYKLRGMPQAKNVTDDLEYIEGLLTRVYNSKDSQRLFKLKQREVKYSFGVTQKDIDDYVDAAYAKENTEDYKKYAIPTEKLINDVSDEIEIADYVHALRDNDIRHIKNSHGEGTNEKYPVTSDDIKLIPWIVQNYDKVFVKTNSRGKLGLLYVKVSEDNVRYYVEAVTEEYHNEKLLVNKQMIKTGINDIPNLYGLHNAINKKMSNSQYLADLHEIRKAYVQDVKENYPNKIISKSEANVNGNNIINENNFNLTNPNIDSIEISDEVEFWAGLNDVKLNKAQKHIVDICKQLDSAITVEFVDGLETNGKFIRSKNKILIRSDLSTVQMYVEVFKHEFMHSMKLFATQGVGNNEFSKDSVKVTQNSSKTNLSIDKYGLRQNNISRANEQGDFLNEFYYALTRNEWAKFYRAISKEGYLAVTRIGTIAPIVINEKLIIAKREYTSKYKHDYIVKDIFKIVDFDNDNYSLTLIKESIEKGEIYYDERTIHQTLSRFLKRTFSSELLARYDGNSMQYVISATKRKNIFSNDNIYRDSQERIAREGLSLRDKSSIQGDNELLKTDIYNFDNHFYEKEYGKFIDYCFKKSTAFEQYVRAELKLVNPKIDIEKMTRESVFIFYTEYKYDQYKNSKDIPKADRDAFTMEDAQEEIIADFFAQILFQGEKYRTRIIEALENADGEAFIGIGDEISSEAALLELQQKEPTLFEQVVQWIKDIIYKLRGMPQAKKVVTDLEYIEHLLTRVYNSKDSQKSLQKKQNEIKCKIMSFDDGVKYVDITTDQERFDGLTTDEMQKKAKRVIKEYFVGKVIGVNNRVFVNSRSAGEYSYPSKFIKNDDITKAKMRASTELDNLVEIGFNHRNEPDGLDGHSHIKAKGGFDYYDTIFKVGNKYYFGIINIMVTDRGRLLKDITQIRDISNDIIAQYGENPQGEFVENVSEKIISNFEEIVNNEDGKRVLKEKLNEEKLNDVELNKTQKHIEGKIISSFDIRRMNDTIHVQEKVFDTLLKEGFFEDLEERKTVVKNKSSGMVIEINKSGIKETFNYHNFTQMPHEIMVDKLLLIRSLPLIIRNGKIVEDNVKNIHNKETTVSYAYIVQNVNINGIEKVATVVIRKSPQKNKFWTLQIDIKNNIESTPAGISQNSITGLLTSNVDTSLSQNSHNVNTRNISSEFMQQVRHNEQAYAKHLNRKYQSKADKDNYGYEIISEQEQGYIEKICNALGVKVVFEDLREMVYKGEILSPDGYIEKEKGIIHINLYAQNPIGFVLKHELAHFGEKSDKYKAFVSSVKKSKHYERWISEKTGESDVRIAEYKYKQMVASAHSDIYGTADPKAEAEMIADFAGEMLFTENGSGMIALTNDLNTKQRNVVIQYILDFISYVKKKLSGITSITFELSRLEDRLNRLLYDAVQIEYGDQNNDIRFSIAGENSKTANHSLLFEAKLRDYKGEDSELIRRDTGWYKGRDGKWRYYIPDNELNIDRLIEFANSNEDVDLLGEVIIHDKLFEAYPELKSVKIKFKDIGRTKKGEFSENANEIVLNMQLRNSVEKTKDTLVHEIQHAIQHIEGFARGGNKNLGFVYAMNLAYDEAKNNLEFNLLKTKEEKNDFLLSVAKKIFDAETLEKLPYKAYRTLYGEVEARQVTRNRLFDDELLRVATPDTLGNVVEIGKEIAKFIENFTEIGYTEEEIFEFFRGEQGDESGSVGNTEKRSEIDKAKPDGRLGERNIDVSRSGTKAIGRMDEGKTRKNGNGVRSSISTLGGISSGSEIISKKNIGIRSMQSDESGSVGNIEKRSGIDAIERMDERGTRNDGRGVQSKVSQGNNTRGMVGGIDDNDFSNTNISNQKADSFESAFSMPSKYSYDTLINKPDIKITLIDSFNVKTDENTRKGIINKAIENAVKTGNKNENDNAVVYVKDIDSEIILSKSGLRHGLDRRFELLAPIILKSGEILSNSIRINELVPRADNISKAYVLIGVAKNAKNEPYIVSFVVNKVTSEVSDINVLYAINAKKESAGLIDPSVPALKTDYFTDSTISISKLLDYVNRYFPDVLPESVLRHYGYDGRPEGKIGESALFSMPIGKRRKAVKNNVIELSKNNELSKQIGDLHGTEKYKVIQDYILNALGGEQIVLSDGKKAVVDKSDARHISQSAGSKKVAQISEIKRIVESATLIAEENSSKERKFDYFYYYEATVKYDGELFNVYLNVGRARNDATYHLYDITQKLRDTAHRVNDVGRPVGDALKNDISNDSITKNTDVVNNNYLTKTDNYGYEILSEQEQSYIEKICNELGVKVVFEDLHEMVYKGEIISPDGYIEKEKGIIHINLYAQNPIGFVLKHELTHFGEKSDKYKAFVSSVKKSKHYERWISEKTGESDVRIAEYKYKQMVASTHSDIYGTADPKAEAEMIADFVGEMLFTENGSGMIALTNDLNTKQRNVVIQYILDFISYVKKKLSGITSITFELSRLEDEFIRLMADAVQEYDYIETENLKSDEHDISFCFVRCEDEDLIAQAEELEEEGLSGVEIFNQIGVYKNVFGEWAESIDLGRYRFYPYGNHSTGYNLIKKSNHIEGRLRDIVIWPELYEKFPEFEDVKIVIKPSDFAHDKTKFIPDENGGKIIINQKLCNDYVTGEDFIAKEEMVKAIQHMIQFKEGNYVGRSYDYWKDLEAKGKLPYLEKKGRYITADEMMHKFIDNYDADMAARRQFIKYVKTNLDKEPDKYKQAALYQPYIDENDVIVYGGRNKLMTLYEKNNVKKRRLPNNYILNKNETDYEIYEVDEKGGSTQKVKEFVWSKEKKPTAEFRHNWGKIKGGNSGFLESLAMDFEKRFFNQKHIISNILTSDEDTIGRKLSLALQEKLDGSFAINESGQPISGYVVSLHGDDVFRQAGLGLPLSTIDAAIARYNDTGSVSGKNTNCFEFYMIAKRPFILYGDPQELSLKEIGLQLVQSGYLPEKEYLKMINSEYGKKPSTYNAYMTRKLKEKLIDEGFDSLIYENQRYDKGSITIAVLNESQLIPVAKDGLLIENNGIEDSRYEDYQFDDDPRFDGAKENNEKMARYVEEPQYNLRTVRKQVDSRIKMGDAGFFEKLQSSAQEAYEYVCSELSKCGEIELSGYDNAGRKFTRKAFNTLQNCFFRDENGDIMIFSLWNTKIKNISQAAKMGIEFGTLNSALIKFFNHKESKGPCYNGVFEQFILNCSKPLVLPFDGWNAATVAEYLLEQGGINNKFYNKLLSLKSIGSSTYISDASQILREQIKMSGYDCIIFTKSTGEKAVIPFYDDLIIPISENGILKPECDIYENIISKTNDDVDGEIIKPKKVTVRDFSKVKDIILAEEDATKKLKHLTEFLSHASNSILSENNDINVGFSGAFDTIGQNLWKFVSICNNLLSDAARNIVLNERDTADRFVQEEIRQELRDTKLKNENGRLLSFFFFDKYRGNGFKHSSWGYHVTTLKGAHDMYLAERQKHPELTQGEYVECFVNSKNPYILQNAPKEFTAKRLAEELYKNGVLSGNEYRAVREIKNSDKSDCLSGATRCLNSIMFKKGYDSIIYMCQDTGNTGVIVFDESQLIPVSVNGNAIEYNDLETADPNGSAFLLKFVEKLYNKNIENLDEYDIIKLAREYLKSPEGRKDKRPYLRHRPAYVKNQIETVYENAKSVFGKVYDPSGIEIPWDPSKPRNGQWDMGHIPGQRYAVVHAKYVLGMMTPSEFLQWYRDPNNYRPELPSTNRGHNYE